jgi:hypothetical protein
MTMRLRAGITRASRVHWRSYVIVGDAGGVQHSASMFLDDDGIASEDARATQTHWRPSVIVGVASGVQDSASVPPDDNEIACEDTWVTKPRWRTDAIVGDASGVQYSASVSPQGDDVACENACVSKPHAKSEGRIMTLPRTRSVPRCESRSPWRNVNHVQRDVMGRAYPSTLCDVIDIITERPDDGCREDDTSVVSLTR